MINIRNSTIDDLNEIYEIQLNGFYHGDILYKHSIAPLLNNSFVITYNNKIIGFLLQENIVASNEINEKFVSLNAQGDEFYENKMHLLPIYGIVMISIHEEFRNNGYAKLLINYHIEQNKEKHKYLCLITRKTNIIAQTLYESLNYKKIATVIDKYYSPNESAYYYLYCL